MVVMRVIRGGNSSKCYDDNNDGNYGASGSKTVAKLAKCERIREVKKSV